MRTTVDNRQSLLDLAIERCGSIEAVPAIADGAGLAVTDNPGAGLVPEVAPLSAAGRLVVARLASYGARPATGITPSEAEACPFGGVGYMGVEYDFRVE